MDKTTLEIILTIIGLIIAIIAVAFTIYFYRKNESYTLVLHEDNKKTERINAVVTEYRRLLTSSSSNDIPALIRAGMATLQSEGEAREAIETIANLQNQRSPLSDRKAAIEHVGILKFFRNITIRQYMAGEIDAIIARLRKEGV